MSTHCLGNHFDIHGGGMDLKFPHHENEIAQSCGATDDAFANLWMHNGFVQIDNEKMAKSLGNFFTIREVLEQYDPEVLRYFILTSHYRGPLNYSNVHLDNARNALTTLYTALRGIDVGEPPVSSAYRERFIKAMDNDFSTSEAQAVLFDIAREINRVKETEPENASVLAAELKSLGYLLGLLQRDPDEFLQAGTGDEFSADDIEQKIADRNAARAAKDFALSDKIRDELLEQGIVLEDGAGGTTWRRE
jgi:cysteinyl-tRNA synthetase